MKTPRSLTPLPGTPKTTRAGDHIAVLLSALLMVGAMSVGVAAPASAAPSNCVKGGGTFYAQAQCTSGSGSYQVYATCKQVHWPYYSTFKEGSWKRVNKNRDVSTVYCPLGYAVQSRGIGLRN